LNYDGELLWQKQQQQQKPHHAMRFGFKKCILFLERSNAAFGAAVRADAGAVAVATAGWQDRVGEQRRVRGNEARVGHEHGSRACDAKRHSNRL
jgi:hypothetical protein